MMNKKEKDLNNLKINKSGKRKSFIDFWTRRRSTKIEPESLQPDDDDDDEENLTAIPEIFINHHNHLDDIVPDYGHTENDVRTNGHSKTLARDESRIIMPVSALCCSSNEMSMTPPPRQPQRQIHPTISPPATPPHKTTADLHQSVRDHRPERPQSLCGRPRPLRMVNEQPSPDSPTTTTFPEMQPSIAMQACRSRLREKLLPPGVKISDPNHHFSSPDVSRSVLDPPPDDPPTHSNKASSYEVLNGKPKMVRMKYSSADSLARQSLVAVDVLHLIPTEKARERNYMAGRLGSTSLLGKWQLERILPSREIKIFIGSWNMNGQSPPKQMNDFVLPLGVEHVPDIVAIGTQESCSERFEWEVTMQETLGPSHILFHSTSLGTLHLAVFIRRDLVWYCSVPEDDCLSVRPGSAFRTKGAVAISFCLFGTSLLFVTSHLTAHQQKVKERVQDIKRIIHSLDLPRNLPIRRNKDVTQNFDSVYWCGDLNFRLSEPRDKLLKWIEATNFPLPSHLPHGYMHTDQLSSVLSDGAAFKGFKEANITFPPTYKYDPGTQQFDTSSKQRAPAYTDRILYKYRRPLSALRRGSGALTGSHFPPSPVTCIAYDSVPSIMTSDHKPVWGLFKNSIQPGIDTIPLAAGLFNREVYLEGMKRRLNNYDASSSAVCTIQ